MTQTSSLATTSDLPLSQEALTQFIEVFDFLQHEREDVRKMAVRGISEQSKDNHDIWVFMSSQKYGPKSVDSLLQYLHAGGSNVLGDILTILINCSADGSCAEMLVSRKVVRKAMRLLDGMERSDQPDAFVRSVQEMTLMLMNNLTATHISAVDDLLQKEDEDMRGFYLGKLQVYYDRLTSADEVAVKKTDEEEEKGEETKKPRAPQRDLRRWILHILLNVTRSVDGQELLLEDEDWRVTLVGCLSSANPIHRLLAAQCYRNCSAAQSPLFAHILRGNALVAAVDRLGGKEDQPEIQQCLADFIAGMLESEEGMAALEGVNAKKVLTAALNTSDAVHNTKVEVIEEDGKVMAPHQACAVLTPEVCDFLRNHVIPYLDDIIDAYIAPGSDQLD